MTSLILRMADSVCHASQTNGITNWHFFQQKLQIFSNKYWYRNIVIFKADRLDLSANILIINVVYCTRCSVPISKAHVPLSNSAIKAHEPQVHRNMDMIRTRVSSAKRFVEICPSRLLFLQTNIGPRRESLREHLEFWALIWDSCPKVFETCYHSQSLPLYLDHHFIPCTDFVETSAIGLLGPALPQLEHLCHRQTALW